MTGFLRITVVFLVAFASTVATAAPHNVLVLPIDGEADAGTRTQVNAMIQTSARSVDGTVKVAETTFADTASAVGCDPSSNACADTVLTALAVDELVWGTARPSGDKVTVVVKRATQGNVREQTITVDPKAPETAAHELAPLFPNGAAGGAGSASGPAASTDTGPPPAPWSHDRKLGLGLAAGGGVALILGIALWVNEGDIQSQIDQTPTPTTQTELAALRDLEDRGAGYALWGNIMVGTGLIVGGLGAYYLWRDHKAHVTTVAPVPVDHGSGAALMIGGRW